MRYYPAFLDLCKARVLIVGAGPVGRRKAASILSAEPASLLWLDPLVPVGDLADLPPSPALAYEQRAVREADLDGKTLVFAATGSREANAVLAGWCRERGVLCNVADAPEEGSFIVPAHFSSGHIQVAVSTGGASPALAKKIRRDLEVWFGKRYSPISELMARLRPRVLELGLSGTENADLFRAVADCGLADILARGDLGKAGKILKETLPPSLQGQIGDLLHELE